MNIKETEDKKKVKRDTKLRLTDLLVPLVSGIIFIFLLVFSIVPMIQEIEVALSEIDSVRDEQKLLEDKIKSIQGIDLIELEDALRGARRVVPRRLEVAEYAYYVDTLAKERNLDFRGIIAKDQFSPHLGEVENIDAVGADIEYRGSFDDVVDFFDELQAYAPYIISMGDIVFTKSSPGIVSEEDPEEAEWRFDISVTGYYARDLAQRPSVRELTTAPFLPYYQNNEDVVEIFREKALKLEQGMREEDEEVGNDEEILDENQDLFID